MNKQVRVAVTSRSFSKNSILREELLTRFSDVTFNEAGKTLSGDDLIEFLKGHDRAIIALERIDESIFTRVPELKVISKYGVGLDMIDLEAMRRHGVKLGWTRGVNRRSVSELVIAFIIMLLRHVQIASKEVQEGLWQQHIGWQLSSRTVGIIGCGHIGKDLAVLLRAFGCQVLAHDILDFPDFYSQYGITATSLEDLLQHADVVTLHVPLDESTHGMLDAEKLSFMKPTAILINTARGGLVDEPALKLMLSEGRLAGAAFDVFATEPLNDRELLTLPNFLATPHIGGSAEEGILEMGRAAIQGLVNPQLL